MDSPPVCGFGRRHRPLVMRSPISLRSDVILFPVMRPSLNAPLSHSRDPESVKRAGSSGKPAPVDEILKLDELCATPFTKRRRQGGAEPPVEGVREDSRRGLKIGCGGMADQAKEESGAGRSVKSASWTICCACPEPLRQSVPIGKSEGRQRVARSGGAARPRLSPLDSLRLGNARNLDFEHRPLA